MDVQWGAQSARAVRREHVPMAEVRSFSTTPLSSLAEDTLLSTLSYMRRNA